MFRTLKEDIAIVKQKDPAARSTLEILLTYSGLKAVRSYRRAHWFYEHGFFTIARIISQRARHRTGIEIHPGAKSEKVCLLTTVWALSLEKPPKSGKIVCCIRA